MRRRSPVRTPIGMRLRAAAPPVAAVLLAVVAAIIPNPDDPPRRPVPVPVSRTAYACPGGSHLMLGQVSPAESVDVIELPSGASLPGVAHPSRWRSVDSHGAAIVVDQVGRRSGASGFFVQSSADGALAVGSCPATLDQTWYLGLGSGAKHESKVLLANLSDVVAVADLALWGSQGPIEEVGGRGLVLKPHAVQVIDLKDLASGEPDLALRVNRRRGALAVSVLDASQQVFAGSEVIPATGLPSRTQVISGIPAKAKGRSLVFLNPGGMTARVKATVLGENGPVVLQGLDRIRVEAGSIFSMDMPPGVGSGGVSVRVESDQPIVAGARFEYSKTDFATAAAVRPLDGPAVVPLALGEGIERPHVTLTALGRPAKVDITGYDDQMHPVGTMKVTIDGLSTVTARLGALENASYAVVRAHGRVVGAALFQSKDGVASVPLEAAPTRVLGPDVRPAS